MKTSIFGWAVNRIKLFRAQLSDKQRQYWQESMVKQFLCCGEDLYLSRGSVFVCPERIEIGNNVHIGSKGWFQGKGTICIGDNVHISRNCSIFSANHNYTGARLPYDSTYVEKPVCIERNTWIGMNAMIIPGVTIGEGAIIGLGAVVVKDVPAMAIVGGCGHRIIGYRNKEHYARLDKLELYGGRGGAPLNE